MKIIHYQEAAEKKYPRDQAKGAAGRVVIGEADGAKNFCMRVFEIAPGALRENMLMNGSTKFLSMPGKGRSYRKASGNPFPPEA